MAKKMNTVTSGTELFYGIPLGEDINTDIFSLEVDVETILDAANAHGIDLFSVNEEVVKGITPIDSNFVTSYQLKDVAKFGLLDTEYETHVGSKLHSGAVRYINFAAGVEKPFQWAELDIIVDSDYAGQVNKIIEDWRIALIKNREVVYMDEVSNSGQVLNTTAEYQTWFDAVLGQGTYTAPATPHLMGGDNFEQLCQVTSQHFADLGYTSKPVIFVGAGEWARITKSEMFSKVVFDSEYSKATLGSTNIGQVHDCIVIKFSELGRAGGRYANVARLAVMPGLVHLVESIVRPITLTEINASTVVGNQTTGTHMLAGTYRQFCFVKDNLQEADGTLSLTNSVIVFGSAVGFTPDTTKLHLGQVMGGKPEVKVAVNRSLSEAISASYKGEGTFEVGSAAASKVTPTPKTAKATTTK